MEPTSRSDAAPQVLVYELNEVPWEVVDHYVAVRPASHLARLLPRAMQRTTVNEDPFELMPWRSWPTFHTSLYTADHYSYDQGQDPITFRGTPLWDVADQAGLSIGLFGLLQSWPARAFRAGGFYVPDSFARSPETFPPSLRRFQTFNTSMTNENSFAPDSEFSAGQLATVGADLLLRGLTPWSVARAVEQLARERLDPRYKSRRAAAQVLLCFDVFWRLHRRHRPRLSMFFSNHVASQMHRFWGDWAPAYAEREPYQPDPVYGTFIGTAMDLFDHGLGRILRWVDAAADRTLVVASSMGQGPIPYHALANTYVLEESERLVDALALPPTRLGVAMYPRLTLMFDDEDSARAAIAPIESAHTATGPLFRDLRLIGTTLSFEIGYQEDADDLPRRARWTTIDGRSVDADISTLGVTVRARPGGGNTAQHVPEGILVAYGHGATPDGSRAEVSVLDAAPSILALLGLDPAPSMTGKPSIFAPRATTAPAR